ncbi:MAG: energy transducer TonB [Desulfosarcinaceae bacterium]|nr:energy transducer TonB [Desulfosarcinaceae bacterium]
MNRLAPAAVLALACHGLFFLLHPLESAAPPRLRAAQRPVNLNLAHFVPAAPEVQPPAKPVPNQAQEAPTPAKPTPKTRPKTAPPLKPPDATRKVRSAVPQAHRPMPPPKPPATPSPPVTPPPAPAQTTATPPAAAPARHPSAATVETATDETAPPPAESVAAVVDPGPPRAAPLVEATPLYADNPPPRYPRSARRRGHQGTVLLAVHVTPAGKVADLKVQSSSGFKTLDQAALEAVRGWRFASGRRGDTPVAMWVEVPIRFELQR